MGGGFKIGLKKKKKKKKTKKYFCLDHSDAIAAQFQNGVKHIERGRIAAWVFFV
jgi:hypothetical protein